MIVSSVGSVDWPAPELAPGLPEPAKAERYFIGAK